MAVEDVFGLLGRQIRDRELRAYLGGEPIVYETEGSTTCGAAPTRGIEVVSANERGTTDVVQLFGDNSRVRLRYTGVLPCGLRFGMTREECRALVGQPLLSAEAREDEELVSGVRPGWDLFDVAGNRVQCFYGRFGQVLNQVDVCGPDWHEADH